MNNNEFKSISIWFNHQRCKPDNEALECYLKTIMNISDKTVIGLIEDYDFWLIYSLNGEKITIENSELEAYNILSHHAPIWHNKFFNNFINDNEKTIPENIRVEIKSFFDTLMYKEKLVGSIEIHFDTGNVETHFDILGDDNIKNENIDLFDFALTLSEKLKDLT